jgi:TonB family protein
MFDRLLLSTKDRRKGRTGKFLFVTSLFYSLVLASALVVSVIAASPQLYETGDRLGALPAIPLAVSPPGHSTHHGSRKDPSAASNLSNVQDLETIKRNASTIQPPVVPSGPPSLGPIEGPFGPDGSNGPGIPGSNGPIGSDVRIGNVEKEIDLPPPPVTKPVEKPQTPVEKQIVRLISQVLTGKALERRTPTYPILAKSVRIEGSITVEIVVSPDGRVESARALNGHPLLMNAAVEAARGWRFQPTLLNGVAVRVTGVITFNFKLS